MILKELKKNSIAIVLLLAVACTPSFDSREALLRYIQAPENGYKKEKVINGITFTLLYKPTAALVAQEVDKNSTKQQIAALEDKYDDYLYFTLSLAANNKALLSTTNGGQEQFGKTLQLLAFGMQDKIHLFSKSRDTVALIDYVYPRMFGMSKSTQLLLVYDRDEKILNEEELNITIEDIGLATGEVRFSIDTKKIKEEPKIQFKN